MKENNNNSKKTVTIATFKKKIKTLAKIEI